MIQVKGEAAKGFQCSPGIALKPTLFHWRSRRADWTGILAPPLRVERKGEEGRWGWGAYSRGKRSFRDLSLNSPSLRFLMNLRKAAGRKIWASPEPQRLLTLCHAVEGAGGRTRLPQPRRPCGPCGAPGSRRRAETPGARCRKPVSQPFGNARPRSP